MQFILLCGTQISKHFLSRTKLNILGFLAHTVPDTLLSSVLAGSSRHRQDIGKGGESSSNETLWKQVTASCCSVLDSATWRMLHWENLESFQLHNSFLVTSLKVDASYRFLPYRDSEVSVRLQLGSEFHFKLFWRDDDTYADALLPEFQYFPWLYVQFQWEPSAITETRCNRSVTWRELMDEERNFTHRGPHCLQQCRKSKHQQEHCEKTYFLWFQPIDLDWRKVGQEEVEITVDTAPSGLGAWAGSVTTPVQSSALGLARQPWASCLSWAVWAGLLLCSWKEPGKPQC